MTTYITAFLDIKRDNWSKFKRTFDDYYNSFKPFIKLFDQRVCEDDNMIVFMDTKYIESFRNNIPKNTKIEVLPLNKDDLPKWKYIETEFSIMNDPKFIELLGNRSGFPEHNYPEYTIINHSKIDIICNIIDNYADIYKNKYFSWVDFGYFSKEQNIPNRLLDINKLDKTKINYSLINPVEKQDSDIYYTLRFAPEVVGGFWFFGSREKMKEYQQLYLETYLKFHELKIVDDDQHIALQCYFNHPDLITFNKTFYGWHKILKYNQKKPLKVISFCLWGNEKRYTTGLIKNIELAKMYYPDWKCMVYIHEPSVDPNIFSELEKYDNAIIIRKNDPVIRNKRFMLWRFEPMYLYPVVEYFMSRDIDTRIQPREVLAVDEWLDSGKILHIMRDHPQHYPRILGGMYGIRCQKLFKENWNDIIEDFYSQNGEETDDQYFLYKNIYENINSEDRIIHDEIKRFEGDECRQFPIKFEQNGHFVGCYIYENDSTDIQTASVLQNWLQTYLSHRISPYSVTLEDKINYIRQNISNVYIMHYTKLVERKKNMIKELRKNFLDKIFNIKWIDFFDRENISVEEIQENCILNPIVLNRRMTLGEIANGMGHKYIYEQILANDEVALVLEDDTIFKPDFIHHLYHVLKNLPDEWEQLCLGGPTEECTIPEKSLPGSIRLNFKSEEIEFYKPEMRNPCTLSCMLHKKEGIRKVLNSQYIEKLTAPSDHNIWACNLDQAIIVYWTQPWISYEGSKTELFDTSLDRGY